MKFRMKAQRLTESSQAEPGAASSSAYEPLRSCCASRGRGCCPGYFRKHWTHTTSADGDERGRAPMRIGRALGALIWSFVGVTIGAADRHTVAVFSADHQARFDQIRNDHDALSTGQDLFGD